MTPRRSMALLGLGLLCLAVACGGGGNAAPLALTIEGVDIQPADWTDLRPTQTAIVRIKTGATNATGVTAYALPAGATLPRIAGGFVERSRAKDQVGKLASGRGLRGDVGGDGTAEIELDVARTPPGPVTIAVVVEAGDRVGTATLAWTRPGELLSKSVGAPAFRVAGLDAELTIKGPDTSNPLDLNITLYGDDAGKLAVSVLGTRLPDLATKNNAAVPVGDALAGVKVSTVFAAHPTVELKVPVVIEAAGQKFERTIDGPGRALLASWSASVSAAMGNGGFRFAGETSANDKRSMMLSAYAGNYQIGADETLAELDYYVSMTWKDGKTRDCGRYGASDASASLMLVADDVTLHVHDRRTGLEAASRSFPGVLPACPPAIVGEDGRSYVMKGEMAAGGRLHTWLVSLLAS